MAEPAADKGDAPAAPAAVTMSPSLAESGHVDEAPGAAAGASASAAAADKGAPEAAGAAGDGDDDDSDDDGYVPPEDADIDAVRKAGEGRPEDDDSLKRYKAALLGSGAGAAAGEPLRVVIDELRLEHPADASARHPKPGPTLVVPVPAAGAPADAGAPPLVVKGGAWRRVSISFHVHGQIVFGLKLRMRIKGARSGITRERPRQRPPTVRRPGMCAREAATPCATLSRPRSRPYEHDAGLVCAQGRAAALHRPADPVPRQCLCQGGLHRRMRGEFLFRPLPRSGRCRVTAMQFSFNFRSNFDL